MKTDYEIITGVNIKRLDNGAIINRYSHVLKGAEIGRNVMIGSFCYVGKYAIIGDNTRVQNHVSVWDGVEIGKDCFIGPKVCFTNHHNPQDRQLREEHEEFIPDTTVVKDRATLCAGCIVVAPCVIEAGSMVGAGSVVLRFIKEGERANGLIKSRGKAETPKKRSKRT